MPGQTWRYHPNKAPILVNMDDAEQLEALREQGWRDSPAAFHEAPADDEGQQPPAPELNEVESALLESFKADPALLEKDELLTLGKALGLKLMKSWHQPTLVTKIQEHVGNGDDQAAN